MKRDYPAWIVFLAIVALALPIVPVYPKTITMIMCGGATRTITLDQDPSNPTHDEGQNCCNKACHAGNDRRKRGSSGALSCC